MRKKCLTTYLHTRESRDLKGKCLEARMCEIYHMNHNYYVPYLPSGLSISFDASVSVGLRNIPSRPPSVLGPWPASWHPRFWVAGQAVGCCLDMFG